MAKAVNKVGYVVVSCEECACNSCHH